MSVLYVHDKSNHEGQQQHPQISSLSFELCMWDANLDFPDANLGFLSIEGRFHTMPMLSSSKAVPAKPATRSGDIQI